MFFSLKGEMLTALSNTDRNGVGWKVALNANLNAATHSTKHWP